MAKSPEAFRTISEVASDLDVPQHVLRFWETKFAQIKPMKRGGGRRYYRPEDVDLLRGIRALLYTEGYTIKGVQKLFREQGVRVVAEAGAPGARRSRPAGAAPLAPAAEPLALPPLQGASPAAAEMRSLAQRKELEAILARLGEVKSLLERRRATRPQAPAIRARTA